MHCNGALIKKSDQESLCKLTIETDDKRLVTIGYGGIEQRG